MEDLLIVSRPHPLELETMRLHTRIPALLLGSHSAFFTVNIAELSTPVLYESVRLCTT